MKLPKPGNSGFFIASQHIIYQMKTSMTYRKWLNLVIYLITAMIILLLIVQKMYNSKGQLAVEEQMSSSVHHALLPVNFQFKGLIINNHFFTQVALKQFISQITDQPSAENEINHLLQAWSTASPLARISAKSTNIAPNTIQLIWLDSQNQYSFVISPLFTPGKEFDFILWRTQRSSKIQYQFSPVQKKTLFPPWFQLLLQQYQEK